MKINWTSFVKSFQKTFKTNQQEILLKISDEISNNLLYDGHLTNQEIGFVLTEINSRIKQTLLKRKQVLEKELIEIVDTLNTI